MVLKLNLCLFDGEGAAAPAAGPAGDESVSGERPSVAGKKRAGNPLASVSYGIQDDAQEEAPDQAEETDKSEQTSEKPSFDDLINGDYKDAFNAKVQDIVKRRIGDQKQLQDSLNKQKSIMDILAAKYGVKDSGDLEEITKALNNDSSMWEEAAAEEGLTVEQYKKLRQLEQENQALKATKEQVEKDRHADQVYAGWMQEAEQVKAIYPSFDFRKEIENPMFQKLLGSGIGVKGAFQAIHHDEIMMGMVEYTAKSVAKKTSDSIASRARRPAEAGMSRQAAGTVRSDVSKLTRADRAEIARRARSGEQIRF